MKGKLTLALIIGGVLLSGCSNKSDTTNNPNTTPKTQSNKKLLNGTVSDGYITGANVLVDINTTTKGGYDSGDYKTTTNLQGNFSVENNITVPKNTFIYASGGQIISTGEDFNGTLKGIFTGNKSSVNLTPITTMVAALVAGTQGTLDDAKVEQAKEKVAQALGIPKEKVEADPIKDKDALKAVQKVVTIAKIIQSKENKESVSEIIEKIAKNLEDNNISKAVEKAVQDPQTAQVAVEVAQVVEETIDNLDNNVTSNSVIENIVHTHIVSKITKAVKEDKNITKILEESKKSVEDNSTLVIAKAMECLSFDVIKGENKTALEVNKPLALEEKNRCEKNGVSINWFKAEPNNVILSTGAIIQEDYNSVTVKLEANVSKGNSWAVKPIFFTIAPKYTIKPTPNDNKQDKNNTHPNKDSNTTTHSENNDTSNEDINNTHSDNNTTIPDTNNTNHEDMNGTHSGSDRNETNLDNNATMPDNNNTYHNDKNNTIPDNNGTNSNIENNAINPDTNNTHPDINDTSSDMNNTLPDTNNTDSREDLNTTNPDNNGTIPDNNGSDTGDNNVTNPDNNGTTPDNNTSTGEENNSTIPDNNGTQTDDVNNTNPEDMNGTNPGEDNATTPDNNDTGSNTEDNVTNPDTNNTDSGEDLNTTNPDNNGTIPDNNGSDTGDNNVTNPDTNESNSSTDNEENIFQANSDYIEKNSTESVTINVLANDDIESNSTLTVELITWSHDDTQEEFVTSYQSSEGEWRVEENNSITFTPNRNFNGGYVETRYRVHDDNNHSSQSYISIQYPIIFQANYDEVEANSSEESVTVNVLANDIIENNESVTLYLLNKYADKNETPYATSYQTDEGEWRVENNQVIFTPSENFNGGTVYATYILVDDNNHSDYAEIRINYPVIFQANSDEVESNETGSITVDVLANDTIDNASSITLQLIYSNGDGTQYVTSYQTDEGEWRVENNQVIFTPNENFNGGSVWAKYIIQDENNHSSQAWVDIRYPIILEANYDYIELDTIKSVSINVLANDTFPNDSSIIVELNSNSGEGDWRVEENNTITFTPSESFSGGSVWAEYTIKDENNHTAQAWINIRYPIFLEAHYDKVETNSTGAVTVDVLANDTIESNGTITVQLVQWGENKQEEYLSSYQTEEGEWRVEENNSITFIPSENFNGGYVGTSYVISDENNHTSYSWVNIIYPTMPSAACPNKIELNSTDEIVAAIKANFITKNSYETEVEFIIDSDKFNLQNIYNSIDGLDENQTINPFYHIRYKEYFGEEDRYEAKISKGKASIDFSNKTWIYEGNKTYYSKNNTSSKTMSIEGNFTKDGDEYHLVFIEDNETREFIFKAVAILSQEQLESLAEEANITIDSNDSAMLILTRSSKNRYNWWEDETYSSDQNISSLEEFISSHSYEENSTSIEYENVLLYNNNDWRKVILFAPNSSDATEGNLVEINRENNTILNSNAGSWKIIEENNVRILIIEPTVCGYDKHRIFKIENNQIVRGELEEKEGNIEAEIEFNENLSYKLEEFFKQKANEAVHKDDSSSESENNGVENNETNNSNSSSEIRFSKDITAEDYNNTAALELANYKNQTYYDLKFFQEENNTTYILVEIVPKDTTLYYAFYKNGAVEEDGELPYSEVNNSMAIDYDDEVEGAELYFKFTQELTSSDLNQIAAEVLNIDDTLFDDGDKGFVIYEKEYEEETWEYRKRIWFNQSAKEKLENYMGIEGE